ncbi:MAG: hypothetical protein JWO00_127 [Candidatus Parcubacteria bacterium]|nr:hypothetical protein [Candidatus Parcubacteria bacterium]
MSKHQIVKSLRSEVKKINYVIDQKIIQGVPYSREARRHKFLISQLNRLAPQRSSWLSRSMSFVTMFML